MTHAERVWAAGDNKRQVENRKDAELARNHQKEEDQQKPAWGYFFEKGYYKWVAWWKGSDPVPFISGQNRKLVDARDAAYEATGGYAQKFTEATAYSGWHRLQDR